MPKLYYAVAVLAAAAIFFLTIRAYGQARYEAGRKTEQAAIADQRVERLLKFVEEYEKISEAYNGILQQLPVSNSDAGPAVTYAINSVQKPSRKP